MDKTGPPNYMPPSERKVLADELARISLGTGKKSAFSRARPGNRPLRPKTRHEYHAPTSKLLRTDNITIDDAFSKVFWPKISFAKGSETEPDENWVRVCEFHVRLQNYRPLSY